MKSKFLTRTVFGMMCLVAASFLQSVALGEEPVGGPQKVVVHLSHFSDDLHRPFMALKLATLMQKSGGKVTLFLDIEGARLADKRQSLDVTWGPGSQKLADHYRAFTEAGGQIVVCPHCAHAASLGEGELRAGAKIATEEALAKMLLDANKVIDY